MLLKDFCDKVIRVENLGLQVILKSYPDLYFCRLEHCDFVEQLNLQVDSGLALSWMNQKEKTMEVLGKSSTLNVPPDMVR